MNKTIKVAALIVLAGAIVSCNNRSRQVQTQHETAAEYHTIDSPFRVDPGSREEGSREIRYDLGNDQADIRGYLSYDNDADNPRTDFIVMVDNRKTDSIEVASKIEMEGGGFEMITHSTIYPDGTIRRIREIEDTEIENIWFAVNTNGTIEEVRDGEHPIKIYESFDETTYYIENFTWDHNESGGLVKKDLVRTSYNLSGGRIIPIE